MGQLLSRDVITRVLVQLCMKSPCSIRFSYNVDISFPAPLEMEDMYASITSLSSDNEIRRKIPTLPSPEIPGKSGVSSIFGPVLCLYCCKLFAALEGTSHWSWAQKETSHVTLAPSLSAFLRTLESGCQLCHILQRAIWTTGFDEQNFKGLSFRLDGQSRTTNSPYVTYDYWISIYHGNFICVNLLGYADTKRNSVESRDTENSTVSEEIRYQVESTTTDDLKPWKLSQKWLNNCLNSHSRCKLNDPTPWWPTRLLYIGGPHGEELDSLIPRIQETSTEPPTGPYMTLSHCWGNGDNPLRLTVEGYDRLLSGIPLSQFPKSFKDAIRLTRFLRIDYLWIDSLCIIQDYPNGEDWIGQSATMVKVYQHSLCNIAATASGDPGGGCFHLRDALAVRPLQINLRVSQDEDNLAFEVKSYTFFESQMWKSAVEDAPLNQRAWVVQERLLSRRQIHCGQNQLLWECHEKATCETFPNNFLYQTTYYNSKPSSIDFKRLSTVLAEIQDLRSQMTEGLSPLIERRIIFTGTNFEKVAQSILSGSSEQQPRVSIQNRLQDLQDEVYGCWKLLVQQYSACSLSFRTDKLVAISGVAALAQDALQGEDVYVAGLWNKYLPYQLLWRSAKIMGDKGQSYYDVAPSWSWASCEVEVEGPNTPFVSSSHESLVIAEVLEVFDASLPQEVQKGAGPATTHLKIRCLLYKIYSPRKYYSHYIRCTPFKQERRGEEEATNKTLVSFPDLTYGLDNNEGSQLLSHGYLMPITKGAEGFYDSRGIVVVQLHSDTFRRIGYWDLSMMEDDDEDDYSRPYTRMRKDFVKHLNATSDDDRCTITLV